MDRFSLKPILPGESNSSAIRLLTYNFFLRPPFVHNGNDQDDAKKTRMALFIEHELQNYDIICFQEVFSTFNNRRSELCEAARKQGFVYQAHSPNPPVLSENVVDGGLLIISRLPITDSKFTPYRTVQVMSDSLSYKGALYVKINTGSEHLHLFTTHTQASYFGAPLNLFLESYLARFRQIQELARAARLIQRESKDLVLFCGDFNQNASENKVADVYEYLQQMETQGLYKNLQVLLMDEYTSLLAALKGDYQLIDCIRESKLGGQGIENPVTYAEYVVENGEKVSVEPWLHNPEDYCSALSLDYIFWVKHADFSGERRVVVDQTRINRFEVKGHPFKHLSDHYGVQTLIQ